VYFGADAKQIDGNGGLMALCNGGYDVFGAHGCISDWIYRSDWNNRIYRLDRVYRVHWINWLDWSNRFYRSYGSYGMDWCNRLYWFNRSYR
jgi:hypothetical protein